MTIKVNVTLFLVTLIRLDQGTGLDESCFRNRCDLSNETSYMMNDIRAFLPLATLAFWSFHI